MRYLMKGERREKLNHTSLAPQLVEHKLCVNLNDEFRDGRPSTAVNNGNIDTMRRMIETDRCVTYHEIQAFLSIGMSQIQSILHKHLGMKKLWSQKTDRLTWCNAMLTRFKEGALNLA
ncbi:hypothetical protein EVAR_18031_1 [Eumeta japonica]|uniref:Mariner Mos1 transposase n=1 Tax=Eumeta variegata TaxID=151549 RepID=A0A4C1XUR6_EUMVA|nr:hypothetical protein EVAR_18031_1 [Eumeta japonica]